MFDRCCPKCRRLLSGVLIGTCICGATVHEPEGQASTVQPSNMQVAVLPPPDMPHGHEDPRGPGPQRTRKMVVESSASSGSPMLWRVPSS
jgi:hypothetical protein